ncbi:hypothetical protein RHMOL_Rhmol04G0045900 [Rhododendron molle]|uniref:Uncharacterized protein n=1 Tax=Rhododendron molle TaxID=49168 RepID=A0ACC0NXG4_RHOML|nr:hypothetical protein RHMOL_Rhmol04G0045900 [Rhododendron molle]
MFSGFQDLALSKSQTSTSYLTSSSLTVPSLHSRNASSNLETSLGFPEHVPFNSTSLSSNPDSMWPALSPRRYSTYAERISTISSLSDGTASLLVRSPKTMKTGDEAKDVRWNVSIDHSIYLSDFLVVRFHVPPSQAEVVYNWKFAVDRSFVDSTLSVFHHCAFSKRMGRSSMLIY